MSTLNTICVVAFAIAGPRLFGLIDSTSSIGQHALWGAVFGGAGAVVAAVIQKMLEKQPA